MRLTSKWPSKSSARANEGAPRTKGMSKTRARLGLKILNMTVSFRLESQFSHYFTYWNQSELDTMTTFRHRLSLGYGLISFAFFSNSSSQPNISASEIVLDRRNSSGGLPQ